MKQINCYTRCRSDEKVYKLAQIYRGRYINYDFTTV